MSGKEVFRHAVVRMAEAIDTALEENRLSPEDVDWQLNIINDGAGGVGTAQIQRIKNLLRC